MNNGIRHGDGKLLVCICACILCLSVCLTMLGGLSVSAEEFDDTNPELTPVTINSDVEDLFGEAVYSPKTDYKQNGNTYNISSNSYVAWLGNDDISYAYTTYNVHNVEGDYLNAEITVNKAASSTGGDMHSNASIGLMIRSGLDSDDAEVFLHLRASEVLAVYRSKDGGRTNVQYTSVQMVFPCRLKISLSGNQAILYYQSTGGNLTKFKYPIGFNYNGPVLIGIAAHSCDESVYVNGEFSDLKIDGVGTYDPASDPTSSQTSSTVSEYVEEDAPITKDVIYRETFSKTELSEFASDDDGVIENQSGNRVWYRNFIDGEVYFGDTGWTDYETSANIMFTEGCNPELANFEFWVRHTANPFYGVCGYGAVFTTGHTIEIEKRDFVAAGIENNGTTVATYDLREITGNSEYNFFGDKKWHSLRISAFDNVITFYWDDITVSTYIDDGAIKKKTAADTSVGERIFGRGDIGISTDQSSVYIDDITVRKLDDDFGGDYDNIIGGNWNQPAPEYVENWSYK